MCGRAFVIVVVAIALSAMDAAAWAQAPPAEHALCRRLSDRDPVDAAHNEPSTLQRDFRAGCELLRDREWVRAVTAFESAVRRDSSNATYRLWLGRARGEAVRRSNPLAALTSLPSIRAEIERAVALDSTFVDARIYLIELLLRVPIILGGRKDEAERQASVLQRQNPFFGDVMLVRVALATNDRSGAERILTALSRLHPDSAIPYVMLMELYEPAQRVDAMQELALRLSRSTTLTGLADLIMGQIAGITGEDLGAGEQALRRYISVTRRSGHPSRAVARSYLARILERQGRVSEARAELEAALRLDPDMPQARSHLARLNKRGA